MNIQPNTVVSLAYELRLGNAEGDVVERVEADDPLVFLFGAGQMLPDFEKQLLGKEAGSGFEFTIAAENGYGEYEPEAVIEVPREVFRADDGSDSSDFLFEGNYLTLVDQEGNPLRGRVIEVAEDHVRMDFNHPLAGEDLYFVGEVLSVRNATPDEILHGHVHGDGGHIIH